MADQAVGDLRILTNDLIIEYLVQDITQASRASLGIETNSGARASQQVKVSRRLRGNQRSIVEERHQKSLSKRKVAIDLVEAIDDVQLQDGDSKIPKPSNLGLPSDKSDNDNDSVSYERSNDHVDWGGEGGEVHGIDLVIGEGKFIHTMQDLEHGARSRFGYQGKELLCYKVGLELLWDVAYRLWVLWIIFRRS